MLGSLLVYLLCIAFLAAVERLYGGSEQLPYVRLAVIPFFLLLVRVWVRLVRVRPPPTLLEARRLMALGRSEGARQKLGQVDLQSAGVRRLNRARRLLQGPLAVPVADEVLLEQGRCSLLLGEVSRAVDELGQAHARLPLRADVAIELAEALSRDGQDERAAEVLRGALARMDAVDANAVRSSPALIRLLGDTPLPGRSAFYPRIRLEKTVLLVIFAGALVHAAHFYLGIRLPL